MVMKIRAVVLILIVVAAALGLLAIQYQNAEKVGGVVQCQSADKRGTVVLFFDDARENPYKISLPLEENVALSTIKEFGFHATFGIVVYSVDQPGFFTKDQIAELSAEGMEIASHTVNHLHLPQLGPEQLRHELVDSKTELEAIVHEPISTLIVPYDDLLTPQVEKAIFDAGYSSVRPAFTKNLENSTYWVYGQNETEVYGWLEHANSTVLLAYHEIKDYTAPECGSSEGGKCTTPPLSFEREMKYLYAHCYRVISWRECLLTGCWQFSWPIPKDQLPSSESPADSPWSTFAARWSEINCREQLGLGMPALSVPYKNVRTWNQRFRLTRMQLLEPGA